MCSAEHESACGYADGTVRAFSHGSGALAWSIPKAHRGAVTSITCDQAFWFTGGEDGAVRLWTKQSRLFVAQFQEHSKAVTGLLVDVVNPHLLHSCSLDRSVISYNIKENKRCTYHLNKAAGVPRSAAALFPAEIGEQQPFFPPKLGIVILLCFRFHVHDAAARQRK
jgi:WD40 repeat protein